MVDQVPGQSWCIFPDFICGVESFLWFLNPPLAGQSLSEVFNQVKGTFLNLFKGGNLSVDSVGLGTLEEKDIEKITSLIPEISSLEPETVGLGKQLKLEVGGELKLATEVKVKEKEEFIETLEVASDIVPFAKLELNENTFSPVSGLSEALGENADHTELYDSTLDLSFLSNLYFLYCTITQISMWKLIWKNWKPIKIRL